jgi:hypothetical protein
MLQISGRLTLADIEKNLADLQRAPDQKVVWPMNVRNIALGGEVAFVQLIITWALNARKAILHLPVKDFSESKIDSFVRQLHGIVLALVCDSARDQNQVDFFDVLQANGLLKLYQMDSSKPRDTLHRQHDLALLCVDHLGRGNPRLLYNSASGSSAIRSEKEFRILVHWIFRSITPPTYTRQITAADADVIGSMLHEVFENTDEHATRDIEGNVIRKSIRGFFARHHWLSDHETETLTENYPALRKFCKAIPLIRTSSRRLIAEISVFDSGPGLAQRLTGRALSVLSLQEEFEAVQNCFRGGVTTKSHAGHGIGLRYVANLLRQKGGFLRLRSGRLSLVADASSGQNQEIDASLDLRDASDSKLQKLRPMQGTLISLLIPLTTQ